MSADSVSPTAPVLWAWLRRRWPLLIVCAYLALLPIRRLVELPLMIMAIGGLIWLLREPRRFWQTPAFRIATAVFLAYWLPILASAPDAVHPAKTWLITAAMPRYWLAALFAIATLRAAADHAFVLRGCAWILIVWIADALLQAATGFDVFGYARPERLNALFGADNLKLGPTLALFSPLLFEHARRHWPFWGQALAYLGVLVIVILAGARAGWIMLGLVTVGYIWVLAHTFRRRLASLLGVALLTVAVIGTSAALSPQVRDRVERSMLVFQGDTQAIDKATAWRLPIWRTSWRMFEANPVNGVGARSYRYAYPEYAAQDDPWLRPELGIGAVYAHHILLEVATETGVIGLLGLACAVVLLVRVYRRSPPAARRESFPYALGLFAAVFPLSSHYAIYSTFWSITLWLPVMLFAAATQVERTAAAFAEEALP